MQVSRELINLESSSSDILFAANAANRLHQLGIKHQNNGTLFVSFSLFGVKKTVFPVND